MNPNDQTPPNNEPVNTPPQTPPSAEAPPAMPTPEPVQQPVPPAQPSPEVTPVADNPGKTLGIVSMILSIIGLGLVGVILALIGMSKSKKAGQKNGFALAGLILGILNIIAGIAVFVLVGYGGIQAAAEIAAACAESVTGSVALSDGTVVACE